MGPALSVLEYDLSAYRRVWRGSVLSSFVMPVLFVVGFGFTVGRYVDSAGRLGGERYLNYIAPAMLASTAMQVAFGESAWPILDRFQWNRAYHAMVAAPLRVADIVAGDLMFVAFRILATVVVFLGVLVLFGAVSSGWSLLAVPVCVLLGIAVAAPVFAFAGRVVSDSYFPLLMRFVVIPMSLFSGVFFPIGSLPVGLRPLAYVSPLWHGVELCRAAAVPGYPMSAAAGLGHLVYLLAWAGAGCWLAWLSFRRRLTI